MGANLREQGRRVLDDVPEEDLPVVIRWLELLVKTKDDPDVEPEELWLLASGMLKQMADEAETDAYLVEDWRKYLDEL